MAINTHLQNLMNMTKAAASGVVQNVSGVRKKDELDSSRFTVLPRGVEESHPEETLLRDQDLPISKETRQESQQQGPVQEHEPWSQAEEASPGGFWGLVKGIFFPSEDSPQPQLEAEALPYSGGLHDPESSAPSQQTMAALCQLKPDTLAGLGQYLEVEFSHHPESYHLFLQKQMVQMVKQARRTIEEEKLLSSVEADSPEVSQRAMTGASLLGSAYYRLSRKQKIPARATLS